MKQKDKPLTVRKVIAELKLLPLDMEVWHTWDESGECWPVTGASLKPGEYTTGWLKPTVVAQRNRCGKRRYEEHFLDSACDRAIVKRSKSAKRVVII